MRLLRVNSGGGEDEPLVFEEFEGSNIPPYAILSHTWEDEEVLFAHVGSNTASSRKGYLKVKHAIDQARKDAIQYLWVDTCCIDKSSSAELSEAINSMYRWYEDSRVCYAYLADVSTDSKTCGKDSEFARSRWFTRGWCLQELLAPHRLVFFSKTWSRLGYKSQLSKELAQITGIDRVILLKERDIQTVSVAKRMFWAASRVTTRPEDIAYSLMGIFSVNMPMLYGEGSKAFQRLQEEIIKKNNDQSLFAWRKAECHKEEKHGVLADSPTDFASAGSVVPFLPWDDRPYTMTNRGLQINVNLIRSGGDDYIAVLGCCVYSKGQLGYVGIPLKKLGGSAQQYTRVNCEHLETVHVKGERIEKIFILQDLSSYWGVECIIQREISDLLQIWKRSPK